MIFISDCHIELVGRGQIRLESKGAVGSIKYIHPHHPWIFFPWPQYSGNVQFKQNKLSTFSNLMVLKMNGMGPKIYMYFIRAGGLANFAFCTLDIT